VVADRSRRAVALLLWALAAAHVVEAAVLRRRAGRLVALGDRPAARTGVAPGAGVASGSGVAPEAVVVARAGVAVAPDVSSAAATVLAAAGLRCVDLVPADLPADAGMALLRRVAFERLSDDWVYAPGGAQHAVALAPSLAHLVPDADGGPNADVTTAAAPTLGRLTVRAQRHAVGAAAVRVTDRVSAEPMGAADRWALAEQDSAFAAPVLPLAALLLAGRTAHLAALTAGPLMAPAAGAAALLAWSAGPALVFGRPSGALRPPVPARSGALRLVLAWNEHIATVGAAVRAARTDRPGPHPGVPRPAPVVRADLFGPRAEACPWCGRGDLVRRLDTSDVTWRVPGRVRLDLCRGCGHVFQNPALTDAGLDLCYRDLYDGAGDEATEAVFAAMGAAYRRRLDAIAAVAEPASLLDVGTGHGHFCLAARRRWPDAVVDGLDQSAAVDEARRRGWVDEGIRGAFPTMAGGLPRSYEVVTMSHYLEHTRDPRRELAAAAKVLEPGGHLMVEVPDPESPWARRLGRCWSQWVQPQHLHLMPCHNLVAALAAEGFDVVAVERAGAHLGGNLVLGLGQAVERRAPPARHRGPADPRWTATARRAAALTAAAPLAALAVLADAAHDAAFRRFGGSRPGDAYRILARRP
jgi:SAM-dependent methyltransferase